MEKYTHLTLNGVRKNFVVDQSIIDYWLSNFLEKYNNMGLEFTVKKLTDPSYSCIENNGVKVVTYTAILDTGYIALRIVEQEDDVSSIRVDILLSSPLPGRIVVNNIGQYFNIYDGVYMLLDRKDDFKTLEYISYP